MEGNRSILFQLLKLLGKNLTIPLDFKGVIQILVLEQVLVAECILPIHVISRGWKLTEKIKLLGVEAG
jgi:hypothetical protein